MKIAVIGAGAMGSLFGGLLAEADQEVVLIDVWPEHVRTVNKHGLEIEHQGDTRIVMPVAVVEPKERNWADLSIVFVKSTHTADAAKTAKRVTRPGGLVLTLQNGMGNADVISKVVPPDTVLAGTTAHGATMLGPGRVRHAGVGATVLGPWSGGDLVPAKSIAAIFNEAGIQTDVVEDVKSLVWGKLIVNVGINAITALTGIKNGQMLDLESTGELCRSAVAEAVAVAQAVGAEVRPDAADHVLEVAKATGPNRSSMGQDVDNRRRTEIQAINGVIVREGRRLGLPTPVNTALTALIETLESHYQ